MPKLVIAASDVHGNVAMLDKVAEFQKRYPDAITVFGGDYVDGHKEGCEVLHRIYDMSHAHPDRVVVLRGNHEDIMLNFMDNYHDRLWLYNGGKATMKEWCRILVGRAGHAAWMRKTILEHEAPLLRWVSSLPYTVTLGQMAFVHAGFDWKQPHPLTETSPDKMVWLREEYLYTNPDVPIFAHNPTGKVIVSGHTPTVFIHGSYDHDEEQGYPNQIADRRLPCPIKKIQYPKEAARYFIDGGNHGGDNRLGNVAVFNAEDGTIVDEYQD